MKLSSILKPMLEAKADPAAIMALVLAYEAEVEEGKEKARARWRNWKERSSTNVGKRLQTRIGRSSPQSGHRHLMWIPDTDQSPSGGGSGVLVMWDAGPSIRRS